MLYCSCTRYSPNIRSNIVFFFGIHFFFCIMPRIDDKIITNYKYIFYTTKYCYLIIFIFPLKVPFVQELAVMVAKSTRGEISSYPVVSTVHRNHILSRVLAPADNVPTSALKEAKLLAERAVATFEGRNSP